MKRMNMLSSLAKVVTDLQKPHPLRVAIDGVDAAGKTTLADELTPFVQRTGRQVIRASIDNFHNPRAIRYQRGRNNPEGYFYDSFNYKAVRELLLDPLGTSENLQYRLSSFDHQNNTPVNAPFQPALPDAILLFDGVFLLRPELLACWDFKIFIHVDFETMLERAIIRHEQTFGPDDSVHQRNLERYIPGQKLYFRTCNPQEKADAIVDNTNLEYPVLLFP
jgi:uridine kinase